MRKLQLFSLKPIDLPICFVINNLCGNNFVSFDFAAILGSFFNVFDDFNNAMYCWYRVLC